MIEPRSRRLSLETGIECHLLEWGGDEPQLDHTVLLVHGFLDNCWGWRDLVDAALTDRFHVVAPDMRGHGDSSWVGAGGYYHFLDYLADLHSLINQISRARLSLVGHSMGGSIAGYYTGTYPERVHRLALLEGTGPPERPQDGPDLVKLWLAGWGRARSTAQRSYEDVAAAADRLRKADPRLAEPLALRLAEHSTVVVDGGRRRFKHDPLHLTMGPYPFRVEVAQTFWRRIACPVLLAEGAESSFRHPPPEAARRHAAFANAELREVAGAGHMMQRHQPAVLGDMVAEFLSRG